MRALSECSRMWDTSLLRFGIGVASGSERRELTTAHPKVAAFSFRLSPCTTQKPQIHSELPQSARMWCAEWGLTSVWCQGKVGGGDRAGREERGKWREGGADNRRVERDEGENGSLSDKVSTAGVIIPSFPLDDSLLVARLQCSNS